MTRGAGDAQLRLAFAPIQLDASQLELLSGARAQLQTLGTGLRRVRFDGRLEAGASIVSATCEVLQH